jgi:hypothetical protein
MNRLNSVVLRGQPCRRPQATPKGRLQQPSPLTTQAVSRYRSRRVSSVWLAVMLLAVLDSTPGSSAPLPHVKPPPRLLPPLPPRSRARQTPPPTPASPPCCVRPASPRPPAAACSSPQSPPRPAPPRRQAPPGPPGSLQRSAPAPAAGRRGVPGLLTSGSRHRQLSAPATWLRHLCQPGRAPAPAGASMPAQLSQLPQRQLAEHGRRPTRTVAAKRPSACLKSRCRW